MSNISKESERIHRAQKALHDQITLLAKEKGLSSPGCTPVLDGIADIKDYVSSSPKIMWVLKEAWGQLDDKTGKIKADYGEIWNCWTETGFNTPTWLPMLYILYGIRKGRERVEYRDMPKADMSMVNLLRQTAYINISKMPGEKASGKMAHKYSIWRDIVRQQIEAYNPDIIIFGGTFDTVKKSFIPHGTKSIAKTPTEEIAHFYRDSNGHLLVNAMHPAQRRISWDHYIDEIVDRLRELTQK